MDGGGGGAGAWSAAAGGEEPREARMMRDLLRAIGLADGEYEQRVVPQLLEVSYRYAADVLSESVAYAEHAGRSAAALNAEDIRLAIQARVDLSFSQPPPREVLIELARNRNKIPLPKTIAPPGSIPLPPDQDTLISPNYQLLLPSKQPPVAGELDDDEEDPNANVNNGTSNGSSLDPMVK